jgi:lysozyme family protein
MAFGSKQRKIARLQRLADSRAERLTSAEKFGRTAVRGQARLAHQQARTFRLLAESITAARELGNLADARAMADDLVEQLEIAGFGPELKFALSRLIPKAGERT